MKDISSLYKNPKAVLIILIGLSVLFADFCFIIKPLSSGLASTLPQVNEKKSKFNIMKTDANNLATYKCQFKDLEETLSGYRRRFSTKQEISILLKNLSDTAKDCQVKIVSIEPLETLKIEGQASAGAYLKFPIHIKALSGFHSLATFLNRLENADTFMRVGYISIKGDVSGKDNIHGFDIVIVTYVIV